MNRIKIYRILSHMGAALYVIIGLLTIGSIVNSTIGFLINIIMGVFFMLMGYYLYLKAKSITGLMTHIKDNDKRNQTTVSSVIRFLFFENIFAIMILLLGIAMLSGAISRVFVERMAIFG